MPYTLQTFKEQLAASPRPVVVDFWAPWCAPCRAISPALEKLAGQYTGQADLLKINTDENPELIRALGILGIPTLMVFRGEVEVARRTGAQSPQALENLFQAALSGATPPPTPLAARERILRLIAAGAILAVGWFSGPSPLMLLVGGLVLFSAVYDRCPIWRAVSPWLGRQFRKLLGAAG